MIQQELWIAQLATASGVDVSTSNELWSHYCRLMGQFLTKGDAVRQDGIGLWQAVKADEYVGIRPDGSRVLVPPRIELRLTSSNASAIRETIPHALIDLVPYTEEVVMRWWKAIPELLSELLRRGHPVSWSQFGRFEPVKEGDALTGYRFIAEGELSELLNRPFSMFPQVDLLPTGEIPDTIVQPLVEEGVSFVSLREESQEEVAEPQEIPVPAESDTDTSVQTEDDILPTPAEEKALTEEPLPDTEEVSQPAAEEPFVPIEEPAEKKARKRKRARTTAIVFLAVLILGAAAAYLLLYRMPVLSTKEPARQEPSGRTSSPVDTIAKTVDTVKTVPAATDLGRIVIRKGDILARIALEKYGDRVFWVYIYEENKKKIADPNNIPLGTELVLPLPEKYGIDAADTASLRRALALQFRIGMAKERQ